MNGAGETWRVEQRAARGPRLAAPFNRYRGVDRFDGLQVATVTRSCVIILCAIWTVWSGTPLCGVFFPQPGERRANTESLVRYCTDSPGASCYSPPSHTLDITSQRHRRTESPG